MKNLLCILGVAASLALSGCASPDEYTDPVKVVEVFDQNGRVEATYVPVNGSVEINEETDEVSFVDSETGAKITVLSSYKLIYAD